MSTWLLWLLAGCAFAVGETATMGFFLAPLALAATLAAAASAAGATGVISWAVFGVAAALSLVVLRPVALRHARVPPQIRTGAAALVGRQGTVLERIANAEGVGCIRIDGEVWTARSFDDDAVIEAGARVEIVQIKGATALVIE